MINIGNIVRKQAYLRADKMAVYDQPNDKRISFSELNKFVNRIANSFLGLGLEKGDRVSILSQNSIEYFALFFACAKAGLVVHTVNWRLADAEIEKITQNGAPKIFVAPGQFGDTVTYLKDRLDSVEQWLSYGPESDNSFYTLIDKGAESEPSMAYEVGDSDPLFILYTGGTTGESKGALHSHSSAYFGMLNQTVAEGITPTSV